MSADTPWTQPGTQPPYTPQGYHAHEDLALEQQLFGGDGLIDNAHSMFDLPGLGALLVVSGLGSTHSVIHRGHSGAEAHTRSR